MTFRVVILSTLIAFAVGTDQDSHTPVLKSPAFRYLGTIAKMNGSTRSIDENNYFVSTGSATWVEAGTDCVRTFGENSGLVAIESQEENDQINRFLERYGSGSSHWTGGMYNTRTNQFVWSTTGALLPKGQGWSYNPWALNQPSSSPTSDLRTLLNHESRFYSEWSTASLTKNLRYICERENSNGVEIVPCYSDVDLDIVLDSSGSIGDKHFQTTLDFVSQLTAAFTPYANSRIGLVTYSNGVSRILPVDNGMSTQQIKDAILSTPYTSGGTNTHLGIDSAASELSNKRRPGVTSNMLVITDGFSNDHRLTINATNNATALGIRSFVVGITTSVNLVELEAIAGGNRERIFKADEWEKLFDLITACTRSICPKN